MYLIYFLLPYLPLKNYTLTSKLKLVNNTNYLK